MKNNWDESKHPRDDEGKFTNTGGGTMQRELTKDENIISLLKNGNYFRRDIGKRITPILKPLYRYTATR